MTVNVKAKLPSLNIEKIMNAADDGLAASAVFVTKEAKDKVPVLTGRLKKSILMLKIEKFRYIVTSLLSYAPFVEFGTKKQRAQPYMRPALYNILKKIENIINRYIGKAL